VLSWLVTALVVACLASSGWCLMSLRRLSTTRRPELRVFSRSDDAWREERVDPPSG
jgi:hypothetical protein